MLDKQKELQERLGTLNFNGPRDVTAYIKEYSLHLNDEVHEMLRELPYLKPWSKKYDSWDEDKLSEQMQKAREEYIDAVHFMLNIAIALDLDAETIHKMYMEKNAINHKRQNEGY